MPSWLKTESVSRKMSPVFATRISLIIHRSEISASENWVSFETSPPPTSTKKG
jgi:hypothetical protein